MTESSKAVFLSYASQDTEAARRICEALRAGGIEVWFDQSELRGGDAWDQQIRQQIQDCALFIPIISVNTASRHEGYFRLEWDLADQRSHKIARNRPFILPACLDATRNAGADVPESFLRVQWTRLPGGETSPALVERISRLLSPERFQTPIQTQSNVGAASGNSSASNTGTPSSRLSQLSQSAVLLVALALVIIGGYLVLGKLVLSKRAALPVSQPVVQSALPAPNTIPEKSIAVLPFTDMSEKKDQEYFSDGLSEELIDLLSKIPDLRVPARTSSFYFKGKPDDIPTIAQKLHVAHVLEGSVRKAGNRLRVTAELIRADTGYHLWSQTYDQELKDVFKVQDEIAGAVVAALKLKIAPGLQIPSQRTSSTEAYNEYLLAQHIYNRGHLKDLARAIEAYHKAIALDPNYAAAYAGLSNAEFLDAYQSGDTAGYKPAQAAADKAVTLAVGQAEGYAARADIRFGRWDWAGAQADFAQALVLDPGSSSVKRSYAALLASQGRLPEAIAAMRKATELDPLYAESWIRLGEMLIYRRDFIGADAALSRALEIAPESPFALTFRGRLQLQEGNAAEALATFREVDFEPFRLPGIAKAEHALGHTKESQQALDEMSTKYAQRAAYWIAEVYAWRGEKDHAFEWLERAYQQHDPFLAILKYDELLDSLRGDPRYKALLRKMHLPE